MAHKIKPNPGKELKKTVDDVTYIRWPVKSKIITPEDDIVKTAEKYLKDKVEKHDFVGVGEKAVSISQNRAYHKDEIEPSWLARFLVKFVTKTKRGVGISSPETFQLAIDECGTLRIILAAIIGGIGKLLGLKGLFYHIAGNQARLIDGAAEYVIPPYNKYVSKGPKHPDKTAEKISRSLGVDAGIIDINDYGGQVVGSSKKTSRKDEKGILKILEDNPLGQTDECTPFVIIRKETK